MAKCRRNGKCRLDMPRGNMDKSQLETSIETLSQDFAEGLSGLVTGEWLREGVLRQGITEVLWAIYDRMPDQRAALAEQLEGWPSLVREAMARDDSSGQDD